MSVFAIKADSQNTQNTSLKTKKKLQLDGSEGQQPRRKLLIDDRPPNMLVYKRRSGKATQAWTNEEAVSFFLL